MRTISRLLFALARASAFSLTTGCASKSCCGACGQGKPCECAKPCCGPCGQGLPCACR